jgi:hypothetical protein
MWSQPRINLLLTGATGLEPATSGVTGRSWCFRAKRGYAWICLVSRAFRRCRGGDWRGRAVTSGSLVRDHRGMSRACADKQSGTCAGSLLLAAKGLLNDVASATPRPSCHATCGADPATRGFSGRGGRFRWRSTHCAHRDVMRACQGRTLLGVRRASGLGSRAPCGHADGQSIRRGHFAKMIVSITDCAASYQSLPSP